MKKGYLLVVIAGLSLGAYSQEIVDISSKINYKGESRLDSIKGLDSLKIDFQLRGDCYAFSSKKYAKKSNGEAHSSNIAQSNDNKFEPGLLGLYLSEGEYQRSYPNYVGQTLYLLNTTNEKVDFSAQDSRLSIITEVKNEKGEWTSIVYLPSSWCGNSYHTVSLGTNEYWAFVMPVFKGDFKTKLRYKLATANKIFVSNEIDAFVNLKQLDSENRQGHVNQGIMDPYNE